MSIPSRFYLLEGISRKKFRLAEWEKIQLSAPPPQDLGPLSVAPIRLVLSALPEPGRGLNMDQGIFYTPRLSLRSGVRPYNAVEGDSYAHERWYT